MADNTVLNPGSGGDVMRTREHADGSKTPESLTAFMVTASPGANVTQFVDATHGLPVEVLNAVEAVQSNPANLQVTATLAGGSSIGVTGDVTVKQSTAANLKALVDINSGQTVGATQSGTWTVNVSGGQTIGISGTVTVVQSTAANLKTLTTLAAGTELVGKISAGADSGTVYSGATALVRKFAKIDASSSGNNTIVSASSGNRLRVLRWGLTANGDVSIKWRSGSSADLTGSRPLTQYASAGGAYCPVGIFETAKNEALVLNLSAAVAVGGELTYVEVPESGGVVPGEPGGGGGGL